MVELVRWREGSAAVLPALKTYGLSRTADRWVENLTLALFWLLLLEGVLRKWVAPEYSRYLFFIRDPFVLCLYWRAARIGAFRAGGLLLYIGVALAMMSLGIAFLQSITLSDSRMLPVMAYGWRQYFLYLPLPFVMAAALDRKSLQRIMGHVLFALVLVAPLLLAQKASPASSVLNRGSSDDVALQFQSFDFTGGGFRPSGPFTTNAGVKELVACGAAMVMALWLSAPRSRGVGFPLLLVATVALASCLAVSSSRAAFFHVGIVMAAAMSLGAVSRSRTVRLRGLTVPLLLVLLGVVLYPIVFPEALAAMADRFAEASAAESAASSLGTLGRVLADFVGFLGTMTETPLIGFGLGLGGNGRTFISGGSILVSGVPYAESDWTRHIVDLGNLVGPLFILYRIAFTTVLFRQSWQAARTTGDGTAFLLLGYAGIGLLSGLLTGQGTIGGFIWLSTGLCMLACRTSRDTS